MSKILSTASYRKFLLKISITALLGFVGQSALAACPNTDGINITNNRVGNFDGENIYFCKQDFPATSLRFSPSETQLLSGGSRAISRGDTIQSFPLGNSTNLMGFNVNNLALNQLTANFPSTNGASGSPSLFNFFTRVGRFNNCINQFTLMRDFLRANPNVFQLNTSFDSITTDTTSETSIAKINGAKLKSTIDPTKELSATIELYYANPYPTFQGQYFSSNVPSYRDCWVGVGTRVNITPDGGSLKFAGNYNFQIGVRAL